MCSSDLIEGSGKRRTHRMAQVHIEFRVEVERRHLRSSVTGQIEIVLTGVVPPRFEGLLVEIRCVPVVVEPQTEAGSSQSKWPDLGVLSMASNRCRQPLPSQMVRDFRVCPGEGVVPVTDHVKGAVPPVV